jgi:thioredoxin-related protein
MTLWLVIGVAFFGCQKKKAVPTEITFQSDLRSAREVARAEKKPLLVEFYKTGCSWCRKMDDSTFTDKIIIELSDKILFLKLDAGIDTAEAARFGVTYYPTVVLLKPDGDEIDRLVGYYPPADFYNEIQLYLQGRETLEDYLTRLQDELAAPIISWRSLKSTATAPIGTTPLAITAKCCRWGFPTPTSMS